MFHTMKILIVDDEVNLLQSLGDVLRSKGFMVGTARNGLEALDKLKERFFDLIIADLKMPRMGGMELLKVVRERYPQAAVVILTGYGTVKSAVDAIKRGAYDYLVKPFVPDEILLIIQRVVQEEILREEHRYMRQELERRGEIITENPEMRKLKDLTNQVARTNATVLITGETGTGKELIARAIHYQSLRKAKLFVNQLLQEINCIVFSLKEKYCLYDYFVFPE